MNKYDTQTPYVASYLVVQRQGKVALLLRSNTRWMNGHYGLPSGKVEKGESAILAACREAKEEIGIKINPADLKFVHLMHRASDTEWVDIYFEVQKYQGEIVNAEPELHSELDWFKITDLPANTVPYIRPALKHITDGQLYSQYGWT